MNDLDAPAHKRLCLDSRNRPLYNPGPVQNDHPILPFPSHLSQHEHQQPAYFSQSKRAHQASRNYFPPPRPTAVPSRVDQYQSPYSGSQPASSLPPYNIHAYSGSRTTSLLSQHTRGSVAAALPLKIDQDTISIYCPPSAPLPTSAPGDQGSVPPHNDQNSHPPPPAGQQYGQPASSYAPGLGMSEYPGTAISQGQRKHARAIQACNSCRTRKQKCDEARPCRLCRENSFKCQYEDIPPSKQDRNTMMIQKRIDDTIIAMRKHVNAWKQSSKSILQSTCAPNTTSYLPSSETSFAIPSKESASKFHKLEQERNQQPNQIGGIRTGSQIDTHQRVQRPTTFEQGAMLVAPQQPATLPESVVTDRDHLVDSALNGNKGLQSDHTTPAHKLLEEWPSMVEFCRDVEYLDRLKEDGRDISEYPMQLERNRGLLRVWGVGEGQDPNDEVGSIGSPENRNDSNTYSFAPVKEGLWGHPSFEDGLGLDGKLDFNSCILGELYESYITNIHNLHPFMDPNKIRRMFQGFSEQYSPDVKSNSAASALAKSFTSHSNQGLKTERSGSGFSEPYSSKGAMERSLRNAIVLLILALGKVCSYKEQLPSPQSDKVTAMNGAHGLHKESSHASDNLSSDTADDHRPRNIDILPGMAYFACATDILGNQQGGNTVAHAQAMILAALYLSQYARVMESWSRINDACRITMILVKADYVKLHRDFYIDPVRKASLSPKERYRLNLVVRVYWTCLQLESDILAEMSTLPPSKISDYQSDIMYPEGLYESVPVDATSGTQEVRSETSKNGVVQDGSMLLYSSHIWLRVALNEAHNTLYGTSGNRGFDMSNLKDVVKHARSHLNVLESWRRVLPSSLAWKDDDLPSTNLNVARLRAKYYGGLYMILRPYLRIANHSMGLPSIGATTAQSHRQNSPMPTTDSVSAPTSRDIQQVELSNDQQDVIWIAAKCINSAIQSTIAFDRVGAPDDSPYEKYKRTRKGRLIVTNIVGTMHAQFGNMLVLAAVYKSQLHQFLPKHTQLTKETLTALFERTCDILSDTAPNSPILDMDLKILQNVRRQHNLFQSSPSNSIHDSD